MLRGANTQPRCAGVTSILIWILFRVKRAEKAKLRRAAALRHTDLTSFITACSLRKADAVIEAADRVKLSTRNSLRVLDLLENPPAPNAKLVAAPKALLPKPR